MAVSPRARALVARPAPVSAMPRGPRDTRSWYLDADPGEQVDFALVDFAAAHAGHRCSTWAAASGGYSWSWPSAASRCAGWT